MRVVIAMLKHETNTFSPVPTPLARFGPDGPLWGAAAREACRGTGTPTGAFLALAEEAGADIATPVAAEAWPSGPVADDAFEALAGAIVEEAARGCDLVLLDLHGAMVTDSLEDGEGALLERVRAAAPGVPVAVALDFHANLTRRMVANATVIAGYQTYPHVDMYETGLKAGRLGLAAARGECRPTMAWGNRPMLPHVMRQGTDDEPMRDLVAHARQVEADGALAATVFPGFPNADIRDAGLSAVVVTDYDTAAAELACGHLLIQAWLLRHDFIFTGEPAATAVARAAGMTDGPVLLLDHCDNCGSGGTMDVVHVLGEVLRQGLEDVAVFAVHDPAAVARMAEAGEGAEVTLPLGGRIAMPALGLEGEPLTVTGRVKRLSDGEFTVRGPMYTGVRMHMGRTAVLDTGSVEIVVISRHHEPWDPECLRSLGIEPLTVTGRVKRLSDGEFTVRGPMYTGVRMHMGRTAVLDTGRVEIVVISRHHEPWDPECLRSLGIEPADKRFLMLKSRVHWRAGFGDLVRHVVQCAGPGVTTSDYGVLPFRRIRRPMFPLDAEAEAEPQD